MSESESYAGMGEAAVREVAGSLLAAYPGGVPLEVIQSEAAALGVSVARLAEVLVQAVLARVGHGCPIPSHPSTCICC